MKGYDEPEILRSQLSQFGPISADAGHFVPETHAHGIMMDPPCKEFTLSGEFAKKVISIHRDLSPQQQDQNTVHARFSASLNTWTTHLHRESTVSQRLKISFDPKLASLIVNHYDEIIYPFDWLWHTGTRRMFYSPGPDATYDSCQPFYGGECPKANKAYGYYTLPYGSYLTHVIDFFPRMDGVFSVPYTVAVFKDEETVVQAILPKNRGNSNGIMPTEYRLHFISELNKVLEKCHDHAFPANQSRR